MISSRMIKSHIKDPPMIDKAHTKCRPTLFTMRAALVLVGLCALATASPVSHIADKEFLVKQKEILRLYNYVNQPSYYKDYEEIIKNFKWEGAWDQWTKPEYAKEYFTHYYKQDSLPQGEVFSPYYPDHLKEAIALFKTLFYAKDFETLYKVAVWARQHVNQGVFVYAFTVAVVHSKFTEKIVLPPIYEVYPQYFFNDEVIQKAQQYKQHYWGTYEHENEIKDASYKGYTIQANYSGWYLNLHPEQSLSYFTEDVGLNSHYYYVSIWFPWWMDKETHEYGNHRGEYYYFYHQQLLARYYLERLSNGFGEIPHFEYEYPIEQGYYPSLTYQNGLKFPSRPNHADLYYHSVHGKQSYPYYGNYSYSYTYVKDYERRIRDALDSGYVWTHDGKFISLYDKKGFEILGNLVESNAENPHGRFYGDLQIYSRHLLGYSYHPLDEWKIAPSALEQFETSLRDPAFWMLYKRILNYFIQHQIYQGPYQKKDLSFPGVKVEDVQVDRLMTYFDWFYSDISNAVTVDEKEFETNSFEVRARQYRLNHKPFNYKININSDKATEAFVKVFIGPKYDEYGREIDITKNRLNFFELDHFQYTLTAGKNVIERNSLESQYFSYDRTTYQEIYKQVLTSFNGAEQFKYFEPSHYYAFPHRLMLPKGDFGGKTFQFYVIVGPYHGIKATNALEAWLVDTEYSVGYPFDRPINFEDDFYVTNSYIKDVVIYHKNTEEEINITYGNH